MREKRRKRQRTSSSSVSTPGGTVAGEGKKRQRTLTADGEEEGGAVAVTLHHAPRVGKTLVALLAALGSLVPPRWKPLPHQAEALAFLRERRLVPRDGELPRGRSSLMVFSSLAVIVQFIKTWLEDIADVRVLLVCSISEIDDDDGLRKDTRITRCTGGEYAIARALLEKTTEPLFILASYHSVFKVHDALLSTGRSLDLAVFDEAHNVHTPTRAFLWGGGDGGPGGVRAPAEEGLALLNKHYPRRLYMTGTPRKQMHQYPEVYGSEESGGNWHRYTYAQLLLDQKEQVVKPFDVRIVINGKPADAIRSPEFFDCVSVLREIASDPDGIRRVKVYHARARRYRQKRPHAPEDDPMSNEDAKADACSFSSVSTVRTCVSRCVKASGL